MVLITVAGSASRSLPPERGTVRLRVVAEGEDAVERVRPVLARLTGAARRSEADGAVTRWSAESLATSVEHRWRGDEQERVRIASAPVEVRFRDLEALLDRVGDLAAEPLVRLDGIEWALTASTRSALERELRAEAVRDAIERAGDYAAAFGEGAVRAVRLWEAGLRAEARESGWVAQAASRSAVDGVELHPAPVEVTVRVTADFEAADAPPTAGG